jgi:YrbI family 3-deoxy-D-manno-octulosonate 8-phosphate phosphatase
MVIGNQPEVLAVVQARGGSKSIPRKNIRPLAGHPLIAYSIAAGLAAESVTRLIVSTDSKEIAEVARQYGAGVPFLRPPELAHDDSPDLPLFQHALRWLEENETYRPEMIVQIRPTSPLRPVGLIDEAVEKLLACPEADCARGVTAPNQNPYKMWRIGADGFLRPLLTSEFHESYNMPRQHLPQVYWQTGHVDVIRYETIMVKKSLTGDRVLPISIDRRYCVDIDTESDWTYAESLLSNGMVPVIKPNGRGAGLSPNEALSSLGSARLLVLDFDGVMTDNRVWITEDGAEAVVCSRSDGRGLAMLRAHGIEAVVLSSETNPVVAARCQKLGISCRQGVQDKKATFISLAIEHNVDLAQVVYVGNDLNDLDCLHAAGCGVAVADAHPAILQEADWTLNKPGGQGAIRELCELIINAKDDRRRSNE